MSRLVNLNVGGKKYTTTVQTLTHDPDSMLAKMFSDDWHQSGTAKEDQNGKSNNDNNESFIDRDGEHFRYVLNYLRNGSKMVLPVDNATVLNELILEAEFYQLCGFSELLQSKLVSTSQSKTDKERPELSNNCSVLFIVAKLSDLFPYCDDCTQNIHICQTYHVRNWTKTTIHLDYDSYKTFIMSRIGVCNITEKLGDCTHHNDCNIQFSVKFDRPALDILNFFCGPIEEKCPWQGSYKIVACKKVDGNMIWMLQKKIKEK